MSQSFFSCADMDFTVRIEECERKEEFRVPGVYPDIIQVPPSGLGTVLMNGKWVVEGKARCTAQNKTQQKGNVVTRCKIANHPLTNRLCSKHIVEFNGAIQTSGGTLLRHPQRVPERWYGVITAEGKNEPMLPTWIKPKTLEALVGYCHAHREVKMETERKDLNRGKSRTPIDLFTAPKKTVFSVIDQSLLDELGTPVAVVEYAYAAMHLGFKSQAELACAHIANLIEPEGKSKGPRDYGKVCRGARSTIDIFEQTFTREYFVTDGRVAFPLFHSSTVADLVDLIDGYNRRAEEKSALDAKVYLQPVQLQTAETTANRKPQSSSVMGGSEHKATQQPAQAQPAMADRKMGGREHYKANAQPAQARHAAVDRKQTQPRAPRTNALIKAFKKRGFWTKMTAANGEVQWFQGYITQPKPISPDVYSVKYVAPNARFPDTSNTTANVENMHDYVAVQDYYQGGV